MRALQHHNGTRVIAPFIRGVRHTRSEPRYNMAPMQTRPAIVSVRKAPYGPAPLGLVPRWAPDESRAASLINGRSETVSEKPAFRDAYAKRRCLVPADGFYEWRKAGSGKQPYRISLEGERPFAFPGLWECWEKGGGSVETFALITTDAAPTSIFITDAGDFVDPRNLTAGLRAMRRRLRCCDLWSG